MLDNQPTITRAPITIIIISISTSTSTNINTSTRIKILAIGTTIGTRTRIRTILTQPTTTRRTILAKTIGKLLVTIGNGTLVTTTIRIAPTINTSINSTTPITLSTNISTTQITKIRGSTTTIGIRTKTAHGTVVIATTIMAIREATGTADSGIHTLLSRGFPASKYAKERSNGRFLS